MIGLQIRVSVNPLAHPWFPELRYRAVAQAPDCAVGFIDACGATAAAAEAAARRRWRLAWLGVEWPGLTVPEEARNPLAGQAAMNGHRFALWRRIDSTVRGADERVIHWIMLNPSTASAEADDPTMRRVIDYSQRWGFGWVTVGNLWSYRSADPDKLREWLRRGGEWVTRANADCSRWVQRMAKRAHLVIVAWGARGSIDRRSLAMLRLLRALGIEPHALAVTQAGEPRHPLYLSKDLEPQPLTALLEKLK